MITTSTDKQTGSPERRLGGPAEGKNKVLEQLNGWSPVYAQGYVEGELTRMNNKIPTNYAVIGMDEYCSGFRAGYFANARRSLNAKASDKKNMALWEVVAPQTKIA